MEVKKFATWRSLLLRACMSRVTVIFSQPGKLGIEFVSLQSPYIAEYCTRLVLSGDKLLAILRNGEEYVVDNLT